MMRRRLAALARDPHGQDRIAGLGRGDQVADRADPADARHERRHLRERAALAELLEAAELGDVEIRLFHAALLVEVDRDLGVPLDAGDGVDDDFLPWHGLSEFGRRVGRLSCEQVTQDREIRPAGGGQPGRKMSTGTASWTGRISGSSCGMTSRGIWGSTRCSRCRRAAEWRRRRSCCAWRARCR